MATKFTDNTVTVAADTMLCAETVGGSKGHTTPGDIATLYGLNNISITYNNSSPNASVPAIVIAVESSDTNNTVCIGPKGNGAFIVGPAPTGNATGGAARGQYAVDLQRSRSNVNHVASGTQSFLAGGTGNTASGEASSVVGGSGNVASAIYSGVFNGSSNNVSGLHSVALGGNSNTITSQYSAIVGGQTNTVASTHSAIIGGQNCSTTSAATRGIATGYFATIKLDNQFAQGFGSFTSSVGSAQYSRYGLRRTTSNDTPAILTSDATSGTTKQVLLPNNTVYSFKGFAVAREPDTGDTKMWEFSGLIKRGANAASTTLVGSATITPGPEDLGASAWSLDIKANTSAGGIEFEVTGESGKTIRWMTVVETAELA